jgi:hypothetical protein
MVNNVKVPYMKDDFMYMNVENLLHVLGNAFEIHTSLLGYKN